MPLIDQLSFEPPGNMFAFVDGLNNSYSTKATRSHVMTNAYREKKKVQAKNKAKSNKTLVPKTWTFEVHTSPPIAPLEQVAGSDVSTPDLSFSASGSPVSNSPSNSFVCSDEELLDELSSHSSFQPRTIIPAGLVDHFSTLPVPRTPVIDEFVAAYLGPPYDYGMGKRPSMAFNYRRARFKASLNDDCSFYAMLTWLGRRASLTGDWRTMLHSMRFKGKCINIMTERLRGHQHKGKDVDEGMMYSALDLSNGEARNGDAAAAKVHWQGLRDMVIAKGGLCNLELHGPRIRPRHRMGLHATYLHPLSHPLPHSDNALCATELMSFISRLQDSSVQQYLTHPTILSALSSRTLLHAALCATNGRLCLAMRNEDIKYADNPRGSEFDLALAAGRRRDAQEIPPHTYVLRNMQSPRPAILVFILYILLSIKDKAEGGNQHLLVPTLSHLFLAMERALREIDFDWYPYDLETVLTYLIRGIDLSGVACPCLTGSCLLCGGGARYERRPEKGNLWQGDRFPDWPIVFAVARVVGAMRRLEKETKRCLEASMRELFFVGDEAGGGKFCVLECREEILVSPSGSADGSMRGNEEIGLGELKERIFLELNV
ncbi:uncharacterized protein PAC_12628 [Phialocephala subalpina]|uniref:Uncharacterized protein n=1 Tax=Phialocephala subalpina TaxID=576137 RepID=A0A1L7XCH4_9HELO|nr:uncharacterized protein PAC_12628 [Phialocephala subalpina]